MSEEILVTGNLNIGSEATHLHLIELCGTTYPIRQVNEVRQVFVTDAFDSWLPVPDFVEFLRLNNEWDKIAELAKVGHRVLRTGSIFPEAGKS